jgi:hypothetical protein
VKRDAVYFGIYSPMPIHNRTPLIRINSDGEPSGYAENTDNGIFPLKMGYIGSLQFCCYYLQYVPASKPFYHA